VPGPSGTSSDWVLRQTDPDHGATSEGCAVPNVLLSSSSLVGV